MPVRLESITPKQRAIALQTTTRGLRQGMRQYLVEVRRELMEYPPPKTPTTYTRTGELRRGWAEASLDISADGTEGTIVNEVPYAGYVQGPRKFKGLDEDVIGGNEVIQTNMHAQTGWKSVSDVARKTAPRFRQIMNRRVFATGRD